MRPLSTSSGFSLIELLVPVVLVAVFASSALPSFSTTLKNSRQKADASGLQDLLLYARATAVNQRGIVTVRAIDQNTWAASITQGGQSRTLRKLSSNAVIRSTPASVQFNPNGASSGARFTLCAGTDTSSGYQVAVLPAGSMRLSSRGKNLENTALDSCTPT